MFEFFVYGVYSFTYIPETGFNFVGGKRPGSDGSLSLIFFRCLIGWSITFKCCRHKVRYIRGIYNTVTEKKRCFVA